MASGCRERGRFGAGLSIASAALLCSLVAPLQIASAQDAADRRWQPAATAHAQAMRAFRDANSGTQTAPSFIPELETDADPAGQIATYQLGGVTPTSTNAFFQDLGTNGRTCFTCHQPQTGWTVSTQSVQARFNATSGLDPIFRLVDGATCPTDDVSTLAARLKAYSLLLAKGLIRIGLPMPANPEFRVASVSDPYGCNTNPVTRLTSPTTGIVSVYRRPLPSTNLGFLTAIMWDGREPNLSSQSIDATLIHAQADASPAVGQQNQIVNFETGIFTAQLVDKVAQYLNVDEASGGPVALSEELGKFFVGINDPFGLNPTDAAFNPEIFDLYVNWASLPGTGAVVSSREQIARGEALFNATNINITGVTGINDLLQQTNFSGFCGTCHDTPNIGNHSVKAPLNIGVANAGANSPPALDISGLPVFKLQCTFGPLNGQAFVVTDPGRALISGKCADIGKVKGPILRGLAARAPYFHNGSAATLLDVVSFYDKRFKMGLTKQQKADLLAFLNTL
jgi:cytochrome c peroxidase